MRPYLENHKNGLVEWLKVQALSSNPNPQKKKLVLFILSHYLIYIHTIDEQSYSCKDEKRRAYVGSTHTDMINCVSTS
jgi:hypothetical protein